MAISREPTRRRNTLLPKRALEILSPETKVVLYEHDGNAIAPYAALSYYWGVSGVPLMTTTANIAQHSAEGIPLSAFPEIIRGVIPFASSRLYLPVGQRPLHYPRRPCGLGPRGNGHDHHL